MVSRGGNGHKDVDFSLLPLGKAKLWLLLFRCPTLVLSGCYPGTVRVCFLLEASISMSIRLCEPNRTEVQRQ